MNEIKKRINEYLQEEKMKMLSPLTIRNKRTSLKYLCQGLKRWDEASIQRYLNKKMKISWHTRGHIALQVGIIKNFLKWFFEKGFTKTDLGKNLKLPKLHEIPIRCPTPEELKELTKFAWSKETSLEARAMFLIIRDTGLRTSEVCSIRMGDIDLKGCSVYIGKSKGRVTKFVCFSKDTKRALTEYIKEAKPQEYLFFNVREPKKPTSRIKVWLLISDIIKRWRPQWQGARGAHMIRHAFATEWIDKTNGNTIGLQWILGWKSLKMSSRYVHSNPGIIRRMYRNYANKRRNEKIP